MFVQRIAVALATALVLAGAVASSAEAREKKIGASIVVDSITGSDICARCGPNGTPLDVQNCNYTVFVQFPKVPGATSYNIVVFDHHPAYNTNRPLTGPPFQDSADGFQAPGGTHRFGLSGGGGGGACGDLSGEKARYDVKRAVAIFEKGKAVISGTVSAKGDDAGESSKGVQGVTVTAKGAESASDVTAGEDGSYSIVVKDKRKYVVSAQLAGYEFAPPSQTVTVNGYKGGVNFASCPPPTPETPVSDTPAAMRAALVAPAFPAQADDTGQDQQGPVEQAGADLCAGSFIKGRVTDSFKEGVGNVRITVTGKGGKKTAITKSSGHYEIKLAKLTKRAEYTVTASSHDYKQIDPNKVHVVVRPGRSGFAKFSVATGLLKGTVRELLCPPPVTAASCRVRTPRAGAVVEIRGKKISKKFQPTKPDGSYELKVPVGDYDVLVNKLVVAGVRTGADVCRENTRIPLLPKPGEDPDPVKCDDVVAVTAKKGATKTTDFVAVPRVLLPTMDFFTFDKANRPVSVSKIKSGLVSPLSPELFGDFGKGDGPRDWPTIRCRSGCATIELTVRNLLGKPVENADAGGLAATPIKAALGVSEANMNGRACFISRKQSDGSNGRACGRATNTDKHGRALGIYAAPGIVPGPLLQELDALVSTDIRVAQVTKAKDPADPASVAYRPGVVTEQLQVVPNPVPGDRGTAIKLEQFEADYLNMLTDPNSIKEGLLNTVRAVPAACEKFKKFLKDVVLSGVKSIAPPSPTKTRAIPVVDTLCDLAEKPGEFTRVLFENFDDKLASLWLLQRLEHRLPGFLESFGIGELGIPTGLDDIVRLIPRSTTPANEFISNYLFAWRKAHGDEFIGENGRTQTPEIKAGETLYFRVYEVSHYGFTNGPMKAVPAVFISLQAKPYFTAPQTLVITGKDRYRPLEWLK